MSEVSSSVLHPTHGASTTMDRRQHDPSQRLFLALFGVRQVAGVICLYYMHLPKRSFPRERDIGRRADRQTDDQTSSLAPPFFSLLRLLTRFCFGTTSLPRTDSLIQPFPPPFIFPLYLYLRFLRLGSPLGPSLIPFLCGHSATGHLKPPT